MREWKLIPETENYFASRDGQIMSNIGSKKKILTQWVDTRGYKRVKIVINKKSTGIGVHRLIALTFLPNPLNKEQVNHKDGNKKNNKVSNLEWNTCAENIKHAWKNNLNLPLFGVKNGNSKLNDNQVYAIRLIYSLNKATLGELASIFGVHKSTVHSIVSKRNWKI